MNDDPDHITNDPRFIRMTDDGGVLLRAPTEEEYLAVLERSDENGGFASAADARLAMDFTRPPKSSTR